MRLSKQERIAVMVILVIVIIALGVFLFIVPAAQKIGVTNQNLANKQSEYDAALAKRATKGLLKDQIIEAYKEGEHIADMFFPEMKSYEADAAAREFIQQCEANIIVTELSVSNPGTATLSTSFPTETEVTYSLKQYATQGVAIDEAVAKRMERIANLQAALGSSQTIGSSIVNFTVKAENQEELTKFVDEINNYIRNENGVDTRKALMLSSGYSITYDDVSEKYDNYSEEEATEPGENENEDGEYKSLQVSLIFYSIERMQDPQPQLGAQDGIVTSTDEQPEQSEQSAA